MSKSALKKELAGLSREQLTEVILNAYSSSAQARQYFEFFLNPDVNKLLSEKLDVCVKEMNRTKWGYSKARVSVLKQQIKDAAAFGVDSITLAALALNIFCMMLGQSQYYHFTDTQVNAMASFAASYFDYMAADGRVEDAMKKINARLNETRSPYIERVKSAVADAANKQKILISFKS